MRRVSPKNLWRSAARFLTTAFAAVCLAGPVAAQVPAVPDTAGVGALRQEFKKSVLGRDMLLFADDNKIAIVYADSALVSNGRFAEYSDIVSQVALRRSLTPDDQIIFLAHELRHAWQDKILQEAEKNREFLSPADRWALLRYIEADAFAFSAYFWACRLQEGITADKAGTVAGSTWAAAEKLRQEINSADGLTLKEYLNQALVCFMTGMKEYDGLHMAEVQQGNRYLEHRLSMFESAKQALGPDNFQQNLQDLQQRLDASPDTGGMAAYLRQFGGLTLDPQQPTALQLPSVSDKDVLYVYPQQGHSSDLARAFGQADKVDALIRERIRQQMTPSETQTILRRQPFMNLNK